MPLGPLAAAGFGKPDHGTLPGLADDDHTQYLLADGTRDLTGNMAVDPGVTIDGVDISSHASRHDQGGADALSTVPDHDHTGDAGDGAQLDHGTALTGLADDDHTQYLLANGTRDLTGDLQVNDGTPTSPELQFVGNNGLVSIKGEDSAAEVFLTVTLSDNAGASAFNVIDSGAGSVAKIDSDGNISANGLTDVTALRANGNLNAASGDGVEIIHDSNVGYVTSYDRDGPAYEELRLRGNPTSLCYGNSPYVSAYNGYVQLDTANPVQGTGSNFPNLGTTTLAQKLGSVYLGTSKYLYSDDDDNAHWHRISNFGYDAVTEHWRNSSDDDGSWTGWAAYTGYVTPSSVTYYPSMVRVSHSAATKAFYYRAAATGAASFLLARVGLTNSCGGGIMVDDGNDTGDGEGADNFYRVILDRTGVHHVNVTKEYRTGGGAVTSTTYSTYLDADRLHCVILYIGTGTRWSSWGGGGYLLGEQRSSVNIFWDGAAGWSWTPARWGIYHEQAGAGTSYASIFDWWDE